MYRTNPVSLNGKTLHNNLHNLGGKVTSTCEESEPPDVKKIKIQILNKIIIPIVNEEWDYLTENSFLTNVILDKLNLYYSKYKLEELCFYKEIIRSIDIIINEHLLLKDLQKKHKMAIA